MSKQPKLESTASVVGPCPTIIQISRTPRHWKFTQHHRSTRPPPLLGVPMRFFLLFDVLSVVLPVNLYAIDIWLVMLKLNYNLVENTQLK